MWRCRPSDTNITVDDYGEWVVRVEACNSVGCGSHTALRFEVETVAGSTPEPTPEPLVVPATPTGLQADVTSGSLDVSVDWDDVTGASHYLVRWRVAGPGNTLNTGVEAQSSDADITVDDYGEWVVRVEACNSGGCGSHIASRFEVESAIEPTPTPTSAADARTHTTADNRTHTAADTCTHTATDACTYAHSHAAAYTHTQPTPVPTPQPTPVPTPEPTPEPTSEPTGTPVRHRTSPLRSAALILNEPGDL